VGKLALLAISVIGLATAAAAPADDVLRAETDDWILTAPAALVAQPDLDLVARGTQLCTDEIELLTGHRPRMPVKFTMTWVIDGARVAYATPMGVENHVPSEASRIIDDASRPFWQERISRGACFGPTR
jgi:hypothetical protein